ncbi:hypothetical protein PR202_gb16874 [Eleusine coracana subsp. coracana]|uniref:Serpin domain-containing protein n=1 Tax=Eleusine coracana subsp. coracana TaxID=191504 RepID=A0AAV5F271_ELECO|nr:hypothetical protein PR202_gb16874 [Eleusine coracana subsp. coracana]
MESAEASSATSHKKPRRSAGPGALTALILRLTKQFAAPNKGNKNVIFSPLSIYSVLSLIAAGAGGDTLNELLSVLSAGSRVDLAEFVGGVSERALADGSASGGPHVSFACGVFNDKTRALKPAYRDAATKSYKAEARARERNLLQRQVGEAIHRGEHQGGEVPPPGRHHRQHSTDA